MEGLMLPLRELAEYDRIKELLEKEKETLSISGCVDSEASFDCRFGRKI